MSGEKEAMYAQFGEEVLQVMRDLGFGTDDSISGGAAVEEFGILWQKAEMYGIAPRQRDALRCRICGDVVDPGALREHLSGHNAQAESFSAEEVRDQFEVAG